MIIDEKADLNEIIKFPKSTIFFVPYYNPNITNNNFDYYFVVWNNYDSLPKNKYYFIVGFEMDESFQQNIINFFIILFFTLLLLLIIYCYFYYRPRLIKLYVNTFVCININFSLLQAFFNAIMILNPYFFSIFYSIYKSFMIANIIYLLKGYHIIYVYETGLKLKFLFLILSVFESITALIFSYIIFLIPS